MRRIACSLGIAVALSSVPAAADELAFTHVTVVDVAAGKLIHDQVVRIAGKRISEVRPSNGAEIPPGTRVVDAKERYLIPGLWDMHTHLFDVDTPGCPGITFPLLLAHGVTGVRDVGAYLDLLLAWREEIESGRSLGPKIVGTGPLVDGVPVVYSPMSVVARTPDDGRKIVDALAARGADFVKAYEMLSRDAFFAVVDQAKKRGLPAVAHVPLTVSAGEASDAGVRSFEHLRNIELACSSEARALLAERTLMLEKGAGRIGMELRTEIHSAQRMLALDTYEEDTCTPLLRKLARNGTWQVANLWLGTRAALRPDLTDGVRDTLRWVPSFHRADWEASSKQTSQATAGEIEARKRHARWLTQLVRLMKQEGVAILAGTDISGQWIVPGVSLHEELLSLVEAGLTPLEALRTATVNPARYFEKEKEYGAVSPGYIADLVLIDANPLVDIRNAQQIRAVVSNGRYLDRETLDGLLGAAERAARGSGHDFIHGVVQHLATQ